MGSFGNWVLKNSAILALLIRCIIWLLTGKKEDVREELKVEFDRIKAEAEARKLKIREGEQAALEKIEREHAEAISTIRKEEGARYEELRKDPAKLAGAAVRIAARARARQLAGK